MSVIYKDIPGYENCYAITEDGQVWSYYRKRFITLHKTRVGYYEARLHKKGVCKNYGVHRLVMMTYKPVDNMESLDVNHLDEDKSNNHISNLVWASHKDNCNYGNRNQKISKAMIGNQNGCG